MSGLFGRQTQPAAWQTPVLAGLQIQQSGYGQPVPIVYGTGRVSPTLMEYTDWQVHAQTSSQSTGGKGGGGGSITTTTYTYSATVCFLLAEGPVGGVSRIWRNHTSYASPAAVGFTIFLGTRWASVAYGPRQYPWGYLSSAHPTQALEYQGSAYAAFANYDLGSNGSLGNHLFEVEGMAIAPGTQDANPADVIADFLNNVYYGALPSSYDFRNSNYNWGGSPEFLGDLTALRTACASAGLLISPVVDTQRSAHDWIADWLQVAQSVAFFSAGVLKVVPYSSLASVPPAYDLADDDFIVTGSEDPVTLVRTRRADAYNDVSVEFLNRANEYTPQTARATDQCAIEAFGLRTQSTVTLHSICLPSVAQQVAQFLLMRGLYVLNTFTFKLSQRYCLLEPMDVVTITDPVLGLDHTPVLITTTEEDEGGLITLTAEEYNPLLYDAVSYNAQVASGYIPNLSAIPAQMSVATLFLAPSAATASGNEIWMAVTNLDPSYVGSQIYLSTDDVTYQSIGVIYGNSTCGVTTTAFGAAPSAGTGVLDLNNAVGVDLTASNGTLMSGASGALPPVGGPPSLVGDEFIDWSEADLTAASHYTLRYLRRGLYASADQTATPAGARFVRCDQTLFRYPYDRALQGKTLFFKFVAFGSSSVAVQDISQVQAFPFLVGGQMSLPPTPSGLQAVQYGATVQFGWNAITGGLGSPTYTYEMRYVPLGNAVDWNDGVLVESGIPRTYAMPLPVVPGAWTFLLATEDSGGNYSAPAVLDFTVTDTLAVQAALDGAPGWLGTLTGMILHWTGKIVPQGQLPTAGDGWDTFDALVPNPYTTCSFESATTLDLGSVETVRAWAAFAGTLPIPGGVNAPQLWIDSSPDGVNYSGYSQWGSGSLTGRFVKSKLVIDTAQGIPCLSAFHVTLDK